MSLINLVGLSHLHSPTNEEKNKYKAGTLDSYLRFYCFIGMLVWDQLFTGCTKQCAYLFFIEFKN
jgi:hypothetical protein